MTFIRNAWYVACWADELQHALLPRTILNQPVVLYRQQDGTPAALEDLCPHRFLPLSMGELNGDAVQCGYHGLTFNSQGECIRVPGQERIPAAAKVRSYPVREHLGMIWIWLGEPQRATQTEIFDLSQYHQSDWAIGYGDALHIQAHYLSLADNLCDPAHVSFVHKTTLGSPSGAGIPVTSERHGDTVLTYRWTLDQPPVGFFQLFGNFTGHVDRWQYYYLHAPCIAVIDFGSADAGSGAPQGRRDNCIQVFSCHFLTPETEQSTVDYWLHVRNFAIQDNQVSTAISDQFRIAFAEDKTILEAIQQRENQFPKRETVHIAIDSGPSRLRRVIQDMLAREESHLAH